MAGTKLSRAISDLSKEQLLALLKQQQRQFDRSADNPRLLRTAVLDHQLVWEELRRRGVSELEILIFLDPTARA